MSTPDRTHPMLRDLVKSCLAAPLLHEGRALPWTLDGLLLHAEFEDVTREEMRALVEQLKDAGELVESPGGGLSVPGQ